MNPAPPVTKYVFLAAAARAADSGAATAEDLGGESSASISGREG